MAIKKTIRESDVEKYFVKKIKKAGGITRKLKWIGRANAPDRIVFLRGIHLVELKAPQKELRPEQKREQNELVKHSGESIYTLHTYNEVDWYIPNIIFGDGLPVGLPVYQ